MPTVFVHNGVVEKWVHALKREEVESWAMKPEIKLKEYRVLRKETRVGDEIAFDVNGRTFVEILEGPYQGHFVTHTRQDDAPTFLVSGDEQRFSEQTLVALLSLLVIVGIRAPWVPVVLGVSYATGIMGWGVRRYYHGMDEWWFNFYIAGLGVTIPIHVRF